MKRTLIHTTFAMALLALLVAIPLIVSFEPQRSRKSDEPEKAPNDWFFRQRAFPQGRIDQDAYSAAQRQAGAMRAFAKTGLNGGEWKFAGPTNIGGRVTAVDVLRGNVKSMYVGTAAGGVFKTEDGGLTWRPLFDGQPSLSIGDLALDPNDTSVIYVGTGEANGSTSCYGGAGVFKSTDGGGSWRSLGLESTRHIARVMIDPHDSRKVYVAAMGEMYEKNPSRGLYRSADGGESWTKIFFMNDSTGCVDLAFHPADPGILYLTSWERTGSPSVRRFGGSSSGIYRSTDGGESWSRLGGGLPTENVGRIGIAIAPSEPRRMYAVYADTTGFFRGIFRSSDGGDSWNRAKDGDMELLFCNSYGWWFGNMRVHPFNPDEIYALGLDIWKSGNAGETWQQIGRGNHVDQHDLYIHPDMPSFMVSGNDGGVYISEDGGTTWRHAANFPVTQFYTCEVDNRNPERLYGGTQDNYTIRTMTGRVDDWHEILWGDGFVVRVDPISPEYIYAEAQYGNLFRSTNGGVSMRDARRGMDLADRFNWNSPFVLDPSDPKVLYFGSHRVYRSTDRAASWAPISTDLTKGSGVGAYGSITTIAVAPSDRNVIYAGCDDGNVWVTTNGGGLWRPIDWGLPVRWVTSIAVDPLDAQTAYITLSGYRYIDYQPHILKTTNGGDSWIDISGALPETPINDVIVDPRNRRVLMVATDVGVFYTENGGELWMPLGTGLPNVPVLDLTLHNPTRKLVAATHGRSMYTLDVSFMAGVDVPGESPAAIQAISSAPNPSSGATTFTFTLAAATEGELEVYDIAGRLVRRLHSGVIRSGHNSHVWDGRRDGGAPAPAGEYICRLRTRRELLAGKVVLVR